MVYNLSIVLINTLIRQQNSFLDITAISLLLHTFSLYFKSMYTVL